MFKQSLSIMRRELFYIWRDKSLRYIILMGPILSMFIFMGIYQHPRIDHIATAIVDLDKSSASRQIIEELKNTQDLDIITYAHDFDQLEILIKKGQVKVGVVIPENYSRDSVSSRPTQLAVLIDGSNIAYASNATAAILTVTRSLNAQAGVKTLIAKGVSPTQAQEAYLAVSLTEEAWFNPTFNYAFFLVLPLVLNIWQQCCMLVACTNIVGSQSLGSWLQIKTSGVSEAKLFCCKSIIQIFVFMLILLPIYLLAFRVLKIPFQCSLTTLWLLSLVFITSIHSIGTLLSGVVKNLVNSSRFGMVIALPSFIISGFTWPIEAMPQWLQPLTWLLPQTWFFQCFNLLVFKNPDGNIISRYFFALIITTIVCYSLAAFFTYRRSVYLLRG